MRRKLPKDFENTLLALLKQKNPISEFELLKALEATQKFNFSLSHQELELFQTHFLLFHFLYQLRDKWLANVTGRLEIHTLEICLHPCHDEVNLATKATLAKIDPLRDYYLNLENLNITAAEVNALLDQFWARFAQQQSSQLSQSQLETDLALLQLSFEQMNLEMVSHQSRKLLQNAHPDRGGSAQAFQSIKEARDRILKHLNARGC